MNLLGLVFSILLILSYGYYAIWDKHMTGIRLRNTFTSHNQAARNLINQFESEIYHGIRVPKKESSSIRGTQKSQEEEKVPKENPAFNRACARLNLWQLFQEGRENHPQLYELAAKLIRTFYGSMNQEKRFEYHLLDALISSAKKTQQFSLEKIALDDPDMQKMYYRMLKGTKIWDLLRNVGYPPLLEYVKAEPSQEKICIFHSHPDMLRVLFNPKIAEKLYSEIHKEEGPPLTRELIERLASEAHVIRIDPDFFELLTLTGYLQHEEKKKIFIASEGDVHLRKNFSLQ